MDNKVTGACYGLYDDAAHQMPVASPTDVTDSGTTNPSDTPVTPVTPPVEPTNPTSTVTTSSGIEASVLALVAAFLLIAGFGAFLGVRRLKK